MLRTAFVTMALAASAAFIAPATAQEIKLPGTLTHDGLRHRHVRVQHHGRRRQGVQGEVPERPARPAGGQRHRPAGAAEERPRAGLGDGYRRLLRLRGRVRVRRQGMGTAGASPDAVGILVQRHHAQCRQGHRREGDQGPQGQAHRHGGRLAGAQPERLRHPGLRQPHGEGRQAGRVLELRRDLEGHDQQRGRRRGRLDHHRPGQGARNLAARRRDAADAGVRQGGLGTPAQDRPLLLPPQDDLRGGRAEPVASARAALLPLSRSSPPMPARSPISSTRSPSR